MIIGLVILIAVAIVCFRCVYWRQQYWEGLKVLRKLRKHMGKPYPDNRSFFMKLFQPFWDNSCVIAFFLLVPLICITKNPLLIVLWMLMPVGELCGIINRHEILNLRILNSELEILRRSYGYQTGTN